MTLRLYGGPAPFSKLSAIQPVRQWFSHKRNHYTFYWSPALWRHSALPFR